MRRWIRATAAETLDQFLDHAALIADADDYDERAQITLMSLHAAKGLEFPLVFLSGLEEGLFPHSRTMLVPEDIEEERRLCYVGMTRAMDQLILTRAVYRRRYGTDLPEASVPSRFLEEVPARPDRRAWDPTQQRSFAPPDGRGRPSATWAHRAYEKSHYSYEDEDQSTSWRGDDQRAAAQKTQSAVPRKLTTRSTISPSSSPAGEEVYAAEIGAGGRADRQAWIPSGTARAASQIRRRHGLSARGRRRRSQDYGTIPSLRLEEAGGEVCPAGAGLVCDSGPSGIHSPREKTPCGALRSFCLLTGLLYDTNFRANEAGEAHAASGGKC